MATIYDLIEVTGFADNTTYSLAAGNLLGVVDGLTGTAISDGEFDIGDGVTIGGVAYTISRIQEPLNSGRFTLADGTNRSFDPGSESNLSAVFLTVTNGSETRYFIIPNDSYGDMTLAEVRTGSLTDVAASDAAIISTTNNDVRLMCFLAGTRITTPQGRVLVQRIRPGDLVTTRDHGDQPVQKVLRQEIDLAAAPDRLRPIAIQPGALGPGQPDRRLCVSPQHRILVTDRGGQPVLVPAKALLGLYGVRVMRARRPVAFYHLVFSRHEVIWANAAPTESFFPGPQARQSLRHFGTPPPCSGGAHPSRSSRPPRAGRARCGRSGQTFRSGRRIFESILISVDC